VAGVKSARGDRGYILLDALIALFIMLAGLAACLGSIGLAGRMAARTERRVVGVIEERNAQAQAPSLFARQE